MVIPSLQRDGNFIEKSETEKYERDYTEDTPRSQNAVNLIGELVESH